MSNLRFPHFVVAQGATVIRTRNMLQRCVLAGLGLPAGFGAPGNHPQAELQEEEEEEEGIAAVKNVLLMLFPTPSDLKF